MSRTKRAPWLKLYTSYTSTPTHDDLDGDALWIGVALMIAVRASNDTRRTRDPWALREDGTPISDEAIARRARKPVQVARRSLALLVSVGTATRREDGAYGIPKFWEYQETPDAKRKRDGKSTESPPEVRDDSNQEGRGKREEENETDPTGPSPASPPNPPESSRWNATARALWDAHEGYRVAAGIGRRRGFNPTARGSGTAAIRGLIEHVRRREQCDELAAVEHIQRKLEQGCRDAAAGAIPRHYVNGPTAWRATSYDAAVDGAPRRNGKAEPSDFSDQAPGEIDWSAIPRGGR